MNTVDREMIVEAAELIKRAGQLTRPGVAAVEQWQRDCAAWAERGLALRMLTIDQATTPLDLCRPTRWHPIAADGTVSEAPSQENPDEDDEGETGPPEAQL